ncbi:NDR1/HIN1-like protein 12 [Carex rostrata]
MSAKDCGNHGGYWGERKFWRRLCGCILFLIIIVGLAVLLVWLILRPTKPTFSLQSFSVLNLTVSNSDQSYNYTVVTATLQLTLYARNPNSHVGVYYDRLHTFASYSNQQITASTTLPAPYLPSGDSVIWAPYISTPTGGVFLAPSLGNSLAQDQAAGILLLHVEVTGRLRWKVGTWVSGGYHLDVSCPAYLSSDSNGGGFHFREIAGCTVDI